MSAGTGLTPSEFNLAQKPVHFYQIWIFPDQKGLAPTDDQKTYAAGEWQNRLFPVASGQNISGAVTFHTDATIYRCNLETGKEVIHQAIAGLLIFIYLTDGQLSVNGHELVAKDQARIDIREPLVIKAQERSDFILIDVSMGTGVGYSPEILKGRSK
ncbi:MAG: hypothetical protein Q7U88_08830 [Desulfocapsaceae bacterium]|nr:hypothetical protein [Desulfocapsaceae bacterium]